MERIRVPSGSKLKLEDVFDNLQTAVETNITNRVDALIGQNNYGIVVDSTNGTLETDFQLLVNFKNTGFSINSGKAIFPNGEHADFEGYITNDAFTSLSLSTGTYYLIKVSYTWVGGNAVSTQSAFALSPTTVTSPTTQYTSRSDSYQVEAEEVSDISSISLDTDEIAIGVVRTLAGNTLDTTAWTLDGYTASNGVIDLRSTNRLKLNSQIVDDSKFLLKDRDSTGSNKITGKVEFGDDLYVDSNKFYLDASETAMGVGTASPQGVGHFKTASPSIIIHDSDATSLSGVSANIEYWDGDETSHSAFDNKAASIGFPGVTTTNFDIVNYTQGNINIKTVARNTDTRTDSVKTLAFTNGGLLGVNNASPTHGIDVAGTARITGDSTFGNISANNITASGNLSVAGTSSLVGNVTFGGNLDLTDKFKVDSLTNNVIIGSGTAASNLHIKDPEGVHLLLDANADTPTSDTTPYVELRSGAVSANSFVMALDASDNGFKIDNSTAFNNNHFVIDSSGNIGIGTDSISNKLEVDGSIRAGGIGHQKAIKLSSTGAGQKEYDLVVGTIPEGNIGDADDIGKGKFGIYDVQADAYRFVIDKTGNVGMGVNNPSYGLEVNGTGWFESDVTISGTMTAAAGEVTTLTAGDVTATTFRTNSLVELVSAYISDELDVQTIKFPADGTDLYSQGGFTAGTTTSGWLTVGASTELDQPTSGPDVIRAKGNLRLWDSDEFKLTFSEDTTTSGYSFVYNNSVLKVASEYGDFGRYYVSNGNPVTYINDLRTDRATISNLTLTDSHLTLSAMVTNSLTVPGVMSTANSNLTVNNVANITTAEIATLEATTSNHYTMTVSGIATFEDEVDIETVLVAGTSGGVRVELNGVDGTLDFYNSSNSRVIRLDDNAYGALPGFIMDAGVIYNEEGGDYVKLEHDNISIVSRTATNESYGINILYDKVENGDTYGIKSTYSTTTASTYNDFRFGLWGKSVIANAANDDHAVGVYGAATTTGTGDVWAGYFDDGDVYVKGDFISDTGVLKLGTTANQRIEIDGANGKMDFYDSTGTVVIELDDNVIGGLAGMKVTDGAVACYSSSDTSLAQVEDGYIKCFNEGKVFPSIWGYNIYQAGSETVGIRAQAEAQSTSAAGSDRIGLKATGTISSTSNNDKPYGVWSWASTVGDGDAYGVYTKASSATSDKSGNLYGIYSEINNLGVGDAYAGYFVGDVNIDGALTVSGIMSIDDFTITGDFEQTSDSARFGAFGATPTTQKTGWTSTGSISRNIDAISTVADAKQVLAALFTDLQALGFLDN